MFPGLAYARPRLLAQRGHHMKEGGARSVPYLACASFEGWPLAFCLSLSLSLCPLKGRQLYHFLPLSSL